jgi:hypothetical protein
MSSSSFVQNAARWLKPCRSNSFPVFQVGATLDASCMLSGMELFVL